MISIIKQAGYFLVSSFVSGTLPHVAAAVYSCGNGSYTSEPNSSRARAQLPKISGHQGSDYYPSIRSLNASDERVNVKPKKKKRTGKSDKQKKKTDKLSKNKSSIRAEKQQPIPSEQE